MTRPPLHLVRDAQRCAVCGKPDSPFGFTATDRSVLWACREHRAEIDARTDPHSANPLKSQV